MLNIQMQREKNELIFIYFLNKIDMSPGLTLVELARLIKKRRLSVSDGSTAATGTVTTSAIQM